MDNLRLIQMNNFTFEDEVEDQEEMECVPDIYMEFVPPNIPTQGYNFDDLIQMPVEKCRKFNDTLTKIMSKDFKEELYDNNDNKEEI